MAVTQVTTPVIKDGAVTSAKLDTNIAIDGNLTVDTNTLYVDSANNRVGIGTTSPTFKLELFGGSGAATYNLFRGYAWNGSANKRLDIQLDNTEADPLVIYNTTKSGGSSVSHSFQVDSSEKMRINSTGNVGIGTTTVGSFLGTAAGLTVDSGNAYSGIVFTDGATTGSLVQGYSTTYLYNQANGNLLFGTNNTERMRITSGGRVLIGTTTEIGTVNEKLHVKNNNGGARGIAVGNSEGDSNTGTITFYNSNGIVGQILTNGSSTSYVTSSDYRLKENVVEMTGALDRIDALKPSRFNFIANADKTVDGFLAHEVAEVVPEAISGEKDAVDEEGNAIYQGIDQSKLVPLLVGAIQELKAEIETLKSQINN